MTELGGTVSVPPSDIPPGRFSVVTDPHGAVLSLIGLGIHAVWFRMARYPDLREDYLEEERRRRHIYPARRRRR